MVSDTLIKLVTNMVVVVDNVDTKTLVSGQLVVVSVVVVESMLVLVVVLVVVNMSDSVSVTVSVMVVTTEEVV